jgi:hypothetical protein
VPPFFDEFPNGNADPKAPRENPAQGGAGVGFHPFGHGAELSNGLPVPRDDDRFAVLGGLNQGRKVGFPFKSSDFTH